MTTNKEKIIEIKLIEFDNRSNVKKAIYAELTHNGYTTLQDVFGFIEQLKAIDRNFKRCKQKGSDIVLEYRDRVWNYSTETFESKHKWYFNGAPTGECVELTDEHYGLPTIFDKAPCKAISYDGNYKSWGVI